MVLPTAEGGDNKIIYARLECFNKYFQQLSFISLLLPDRLRMQVVEIDGRNKLRTSCEWFLLKSIPSCQATEMTQSN